MMMLFVCIVLNIRFDTAFQNVTEGDVITITLVADKRAEFQVSFTMQIIPITASSKIYHLLPLIPECYNMNCIGEDYYHKDTLEIILEPGQQVGHVDIATVDDEVVELNKSLTVRIGHIVVSEGIDVQIGQPNSSLIEIIDNDGNIKNLLLRFTCGVTQKLMLTCW